jgi:citrate synthase
MVNPRLTTTEAAARLGVKPETLYAYVSRGILRRERGSDGSTFDAREVARLARTGRGPSRSAPREQASAGDADGFYDPVFVTGLTLIEDGRLYYRGCDVVELSRSRTFEQVAEWLWAGEWTDPVPWQTPATAQAAVGAALEPVSRSALPVERFMVAVVASALSDDLRHDLSAAAVPIVGRGLISCLVDSLQFARSSGTRRTDGSIADRLWTRVSPMPRTKERSLVLDGALVLVADHELAPSTLAVRVAAAFRADPYAAVMTGLGPASGSWYSGSSGAPTEVEELLAEAEATDAEKAIGERVRRTGAPPHGFGMPLYPSGDPRGAEILSRLGELDAPPRRREVVERVLEVGSRRGFPAPNIDMGLGALSYCAGMRPGSGQAISTLGKVAGWLAHSMEEYASPTRFRSRAVYVGERPAVAPSGTDAGVS